MKSLQDKIHYTFRKESILNNALTHSSYANEAKRGLSSNERLEFLGDAVLSIVVSDHIYRYFDHLP